MAPSFNEDYSKKNMSLYEAMEWAKYCNQKMRTGEDLNYKWTQNGEEFVASWQ